MNWFYFQLITAIPNTAFGLLYGDFLESIGDETTGTALSSGLFFTSQAFSGELVILLPHDPWHETVIGRLLWDETLGI